MSMKLPITGQKLEPSFAAFRPNRQKPKTGMLLHYDNDSILTLSLVAAQASKLSAAAPSVQAVAPASKLSATVPSAQGAAMVQERSPATPMLDWPRTLEASGAELKSADGHFVAARLASASRQSQPPVPDAHPGSRISAMRPPGTIGQDQAAIGFDAAPAQVTVGATADGKARSARPLSAADKVKHNLYKIRPSSAIGSRTRQQSMPSLPRASGSVRAADTCEHTTEEAQVLHNELLKQVATPLRQSSAELAAAYHAAALSLTKAANQRSRSREKVPANLEMRRQRSVPTLSLLNLSRPYSACRSTMCW